MCTELEESFARGSEALTGGAGGPGGDEVTGLTSVALMSLSPSVRLASNGTSEALNKRNSSSPWQAPPSRRWNQSW